MSAIMQLLTLYARRHPDGSVTLHNADGAQVARYDVWHSLRPTKRNRYVTHNCFRYLLQWQQ